MLDIAKIALNTQNTQTHRAAHKKCIEQFDSQINFQTEGYNMHRQTKRQKS